MEAMNKIYEMCNPLWSSDTFIFSMKHFSCIFGDIDLICFIKVSHLNKIEEIGCDFDKRLGFHISDYSNLLMNEEIRDVSPKHKRRFVSIGDEHWLGLYELKLYIKELLNELYKGR